MLYSMTGYGAAEYKDTHRRIKIEIRSINSKIADIKFRIAYNLKDYELPLRKIVQERLKRGKVDINITIEESGETGAVVLHTELIQHYYHLLSDLKKKTPGLDGDMLQTIIRIPSVVSETERELDDYTYETLKSTLNEALDNLMKHRMEEGRGVYTEFKSRVAQILELLGEIRNYEAERIDKLRDRFNQSLIEFGQSVTVDKNRMEQEIIYYMEKYDISEEKTRLAQHCEFFLDQLESHEMALGKKLNFISQEMGREINTLGSKANSSAMQHIVVKMKDELEKIKEQLGNIV